MRIRAPEAVSAEGPISGKIVVTFVPDAPISVQYLADRIHRAYPTHQLDDQNAVLTEQDHEDAPERIIPRDHWGFARLDNDRVVLDASHVYMGSGFKPGKIWVIYTTAGAPLRGVVCWPHAIWDHFSSTVLPRTAILRGRSPVRYSFGVSQSGRFLRHFLYLGLNQDEQGRMVFDGLIPHVGGGKHGEFNHRFAQPSSQASRSPNSLFP